MHGWVHGLGAFDELRQAVGGVVLRHVVDVEHRGLDVRVPHVGLDVGQRERLHGDGAERVAQVVQPELRQPCGRERRHEVHEGDLLSDSHPTAQAHPKRFTKATEQQIHEANERARNRAA